MGCCSYFIVMKLFAHNVELRYLEFVLVGTKCSYRFHYQLLINEQTKCKMARNLNFQLQIKMLALGLLCGCMLQNGAYALFYDDTLRGDI